MTYLQPLLTFFLGLLLVCTFLFRKGQRGWLIYAAWGALFAVTWPPFAWLASRPLEASYSHRPYPEQDADAIAVLAVGILPESFQQPYPLPDYATFRNCERAAWLHTRWHNLPVLVSGGPPEPGTTPIALVMKDVLLHYGVPEAMIWTENQSTSTYKNAEYSSRILKQHGAKRVILIADAQSMPRASACFRKQGIEVTPAPSSFCELKSLNDLLPSWRAVALNEVTLHEILGFGWYWLCNRV